MDPSHDKPEPVSGPYGPIPIPGGAAGRGTEPRVDPFACRRRGAEPGGGPGAPAGRSTTRATVCAGYRETECAGDRIMCWSRGLRLCAGYRMRWRQNTLPMCAWGMAASLRVGPTQTPSAAPRRRRRGIVYVRCRCARGGHGGFAACWPEASLLRLAVMGLPARGGPGLGSVGYSPDKPMLESVDQFVAREADGYNADVFSRKRVSCQQ